MISSLVAGHLQLGVRSDGCAEDLLEERIFILVDGTYVGISLAATGDFGILPRRSMFGIFRSLSSVAPSASPLFRLRHPHPPRRNTAHSTPSTPIHSPSPSNRDFSKTTTTSSFSRGSSTRLLNAPAYTVHVFCDLRLVVVRISSVPGDRKLAP